MSHTQHVDRFPLVSGLTAVVAGPILLATGAFPGWSIVITAIGAIVLWAQWKIIGDARHTPTTNKQPRMVGSTPTDVAHNRGVVDEPIAVGSTY